MKIENAVIQDGYADIIIDGRVNIVSRSKISTIRQLYTAFKDWQSSFALAGKSIMVQHIDFDGNRTLWVKSDSELILLLGVPRVPVETITEKEKQAIKRTYIKGDRDFGTKGTCRRYGICDETLYAILNAA